MAMVPRYQSRKSCVHQHLHHLTRFSIMAVSSAGDPRYDTPGNLLLGYEFKPAKIIGNFGSFIGFLFQFLFMFCCGYAYFILNSKVLVPLILKPHGALIYVLAGLASVSLTYPLIGFLLNRLPSIAGWARYSRLIPS